MRLSYLHFDPFSTKCTHSPPRHSIHAHERDVFDMLSCGTVEGWHAPRIVRDDRGIYRCIFDSIEQILGEYVREEGQAPLCCISVSVTKYQ